MKKLNKTSNCNCPTSCKNVPNKDVALKHLEAVQHFTVALLFPQFHVNKNGVVNFSQTDVLIHVVNKHTNRILDVERSDLRTAQRAEPCHYSALRCDVAVLPSERFVPGVRPRRVIQMIDENKEQLRNLFRTHNVLDVQPAVSGKAPDDFSTLQVREGEVMGRG